MGNNTKKNVIWNMIGTTANAFNSLFFMIIVTRINGLKDSGIFYTCFFIGLFVLFLLVIMKAGFFKLRMLSKIFQIKNILYIEYQAAF